MPLLGRAAWQILPKLLLLNSYNLNIIVHFDRCLLLMLLIIVVLLILQLIINRQSLVTARQAFSFIVWFQIMLLTCRCWIVITRHIDSFQFLRRTRLLRIIMVVLFTVGVRCISRCCCILGFFLRENIVSDFWMPVIAFLWILLCGLLRLTWLVVLACSLVREYRLIEFLFLDLLEFVVRILFRLLYLFFLVIVVLALR